MQLRTLSILIASATYLGSASAAPTLLGDTISFVRAYPDTSTPFGPSIPDTTVVAGPSDIVTWGSTSPATFNPEANSVTLTFLNATQYEGTGSTFDGFIISGLDNDIASVSLLTNTSGLTVDLTNDLRSIFVDLSGMTRALGSLTFAVNLAAPVASVPEPATLPALALGMVGLAGLSRGRNGLARKRRR